MESERVARERAVAGQRFSLLLEAAPDAILEVDPHRPNCRSEHRSGAAVSALARGISWIAGGSVAPRAISRRPLRSSRPLRCSSGAPPDGRRSGFVCRPQGRYGVRGRHQSQPAAGGTRRGARDVRPPRRQPAARSRREDSGAESESGATLVGARRRESRAFIEEPGSRTGQSAEERIPGQHESRAAHSVEHHPRILGVALGAKRRAVERKAEALL